MEKEGDKIHRFLIEEEYEGERLDRTLSLLMPTLSRSYIQKIIQSQGVWVNGKVCTIKKYTVHEEDVLELLVPAEQVLKVEGQNIPLDIIYEDEDLMVVNKPKGLIVHPGAGNPDGTLVNAILYHCGDRLSSINGIIRPGIVHRIDKDTSGLLMIAKNDFAHRELAKQLAEHTITRGYKALVYNSFQGEEGRIDIPIGRDPKMRLRQKAGAPGGKEAVTNYKVLERLGNYTLIEARLETGRTHQIRVHMAHIHHPLVGDPLYGSAKNSLGAQGQMLHAYLLGFVHPSTGEYMEFHSELPEEFYKILAKLRGGRG